MTQIKWHYISEGEDHCSWNVPHSEFNERWPQYILELDNVIVGYNGVIFNDNFEYIKEANFSYGFWNFLSNDQVRPNNLKEYLDSSYEFFPVNSERKKVDEELPLANYVFALHFFNWYPFGHHFDVMLALKKIEELQLSSPRLLVNAANWGAIKELDNHFKLFGYPPQQLNKLDIKEDKYFFIPKLFYPSPASYPANPSKMGLAYARSKYMSLIEKPQVCDKQFYLSRENCAARKVVNEEEVQNFLKKKGFIVISETKSIAEDVKNFSQARRLIGPHGSRWHNLFLSTSLEECWEFCPDNRKDLNFFGMGKNMGLQYNWISTAADKDHNITISLDYLKSIL